MSSRTRYVLAETLISMAINTALSIGFVFLVFHAQPRIAVMGGHGIVLDMAPQTFMVALMSCLVPALLTRRRHAAGVLTWNPQSRPSPVSHVWFRALLLAVFATCVVVAVSWIILPHLFPAGVAFGRFTIAKALFGMSLAAIVTPWAMGRVLR